VTCSSAGRRPPGWTPPPTLSSRLFWVIGGVIILAFLLLMAVFRSVVIPVKAAIMNLLSVAAAYGVIVAVFQWGWGGSIIGIVPRAHRSLDTLMMFTILFACRWTTRSSCCPDARGVAADRCERHRRGRRTGQDGPGHHRRRRHHGLCLRLLRHRRPVTRPQGSSAWAWPHPSSSTPASSGWCSSPR